MTLPTLFNFFRAQFLHLSYQNVKIAHLTMWWGWLAWDNACQVLSIVTGKQPGLKQLASRNSCSKGVRLVAVVLVAGVVRRLGLNPLEMGDKRKYLWGKALLPGTFLPPNI